MVNRHIIDRKLPEKAFMRFYYPSTEGVLPSTIVTVPFFENPVIKESKRARYKKYNLISRSSNLYSYLGADSRKFNLSFSLSLPHLMEEYPQAVQAGQYITNMGTPTANTSQSIRDSFGSPDTAIFSSKNQIAGIQNKFLSLEGVQDTARTVLNTDWGKNGMTMQEFNYLKDVYNLSRSDVSNKSIEGVISDHALKKSFLDYGGARSAFEGNDNDIYSTKDEIFGTKLRAIQIIMYWVNIIRSSVINNARNPLLGPPVVRLNHGVMYQNVACLCTNYSINIKEAWGYDVNTMMPRSIDIKMNLEELKAGDFQEYNYGEIINQDNLNGWESTIGEETPQSLDPGYLA
jgi:hypothetical protein